MPEIFHNNYVQIILRCIAVYFFVIIAIRVFGKKELAQLSVIDLVFILLISNSVQNAMVGPDISLAGGIIAATALFVVNFILKKILYSNKNVNELLQGKAILLIYKGEIQTDNLKKAEITLEELEAAVREHGVKDCQRVDLAMLEVDGNISIISDDFQNKSVQPCAAMGHRKKHKFKGRLGQN
ncbi:DUF421 domain-containing protein [Ferruginibacter sp. SUN002]|uniref:DUF421 domain-containing protein n=1 Tax=Ferruginibacter sp. SUN002 TaxID=2937789 RepID=UPI003D359D2F